MMNEKKTRREVLGGIGAAGAVVAASTASMGAGWSAGGVMEGGGPGGPPPYNDGCVGNSMDLKCSYPTEPEFYFPRTSEEAMKVADAAAIQEEWDLSPSVWDSGVTFKKRYENLYFFLSKVSARMIRGGAKGYLFVLASPEVCTIFETATAGFAPSSHYGWPQPVGFEQIEKLGVVNNRWTIIRSSMTPIETLLIGVGHTDTQQFNPDNYAKIELKNFLI